MRHHLRAALVILAMLAVQSTANATIAVVTGTIVQLSINSNINTPATEIVIFNLTTQPAAAATGCSAPASFFAFSASSVTDAATRRDMLAVLLAAKTAGVSVLVSYDNAGAYCDVTGYPAVYAIQMQAN
jgi:hypothetical protein